MPRNRHRENKYCRGEDCLKTQMFLEVDDAWICVVCSYRLYKKAAGSKGCPEQKDTLPPPAEIE